MPRIRKPKKLKVQIIGPKDDVKGDPYRILDRLITAHHPHLAESKIALAWHLGWKADADGHLRLGQAHKPRETDRHLHGYDFVILLNRFTWNLPDWTEARMAALLDHELCHCGVVLDKEGETVLDERGRPVYRMRKHDVEEFQAIVERHGAWKGDLVHLCRTALEERKRPLFAGEEASGRKKRTRRAARNG